jgi:hypothetical protein
MSSTASSYTGHCLCGALVYKVAGPLTHACHCHCESCRRAAGAPFVTWVTAPRASFEVLAGDLAIIRSSPQVERGFCRDCGATLSYAYQGRPDEIDITVVSLDHPESVVPQAHLFVSEKLPWVSINDGLPTFDQGS